MKDSTTRVLIICATAAVLGFFATTGGCTYHQYRDCLALKAHAIEQNQPVVAAAIACNRAG